MRLFLVSLLAVVGFQTSARAQTVLFSEDFESGFANWSMNGLWNEQDSSEACTGSLVPFPSGTHAAWCGSSTTCDFTLSNTDNEDLTELQPIVLPNTTGVLELSYRTHSAAEDDGVWDLRQVEVAVNNNPNWIWVGAAFSTGAGWRAEVVDLTRFAGSSIRFRFRFFSGDTANNDTLGWLIEDVQITERDAAAISNCLGDGTWLDCPCNNRGGLGRGCASSFNPAGAGLVAVGSPKVGADTLRLTADGMAPSAAATIIQSIAYLRGSQLNVGGDGWMCLTTPLVRIRTITAVGGVISYPGPGDVPISVRGAIPALGGVRYYTVRYRNAANFCTASTFNLTNGLIVTWRP